MPSFYTDNYEIIWLAERYCKIEPRVGILAIIRDICHVFELKEHQIYDRINVHEVSIPRQIAMYVAKQLTGYNDVKIAKSFCRDRTSLYWGVKVVKNMMETNDERFMWYWRRYVTDSRLYKQNEKSFVF